ncbi:GcrA family cell cycle regulator [Roseomonas sp. HF4]|uniref:GcrA family cell cycle regulator n=1 Tax=Roseomonas sp. HF4 TaxID=2562313 RepID=UPI0010C13D07|nr:GcrA family cell cycle regulator [Roseomonas sp. HF4]
MDWTAEAIERLKALWTEGHSTAEIGRRMGISKNAVVGKAHRLNLSARPSPIRRDATPRPAPAARPARPALVPMQRLVSAPPPRPAAAPAPAPVAVAPVVRSFPAARPRMGARSCCWPLGEPGTPGFHFCGADPMAGKPYCTEHAALAYVKPRDRREDAA